MPNLVEALGRGDSCAVADLIASGEDIAYTREHGYTSSWGFHRNRTQPS